MLLPYVLYTCKRTLKINFKISGKYRTLKKSIGIFCLRAGKKNFSIVETCCHIHATCFPFMLQQLLNISWLISTLLMINP